MARRAPPEATLAALRLLFPLLDQRLLHATALDSADLAEAELFVRTEVLAAKPACPAPPPSPPRAAPDLSPGDAAQDQRCYAQTAAPGLDGAANCPGASSSFANSPGLLGQDLLNAPVVLQQPAVQPENLSLPDAIAVVAGGSHIETSSQLQKACISTAGSSTSQADEDERASCCISSGELSYEPDLAGLRLEFQHAALKESTKSSQVEATSCMGSFQAPDVQPLVCLSSRFPNNVNGLADLIEESTSMKNDLRLHMLVVQDLCSAAQASEEAARIAHDEADRAGSTIKAQADEMLEVFPSASKELDSRTADVAAEHAILEAAASGLRARVEDIQRQGDATLQYLIEVLPLPVLAVLCLSAIRKVKAGLTERVEDAARRQLEAQVLQARREEDAHKQLAAVRMDMREVNEKLKLLKEQAQSNAEIREFLAKQSTAVDLLQTEMTTVLEEACELNKQLTAMSCQGSLGNTVPFPLKPLQHIVTSPIVAEPSVQSAITTRTMAAPPTKPPARFTSADELDHSRSGLQRARSDTLHACALHDCANLDDARSAASDVTPREEASCVGGPPPLLSVFMGQKEPPIGGSNTFAALDMALAESIQPPALASVPHLEEQSSAGTRKAGVEDEVTGADATKLIQALLPRIGPTRESISTVTDFSKMSYSPEYDGCEQRMALFADDTSAFDPGTAQIFREFTNSGPLQSVWNENEDGWELVPKLAGFEKQSGLATANTSATVSTSSCSSGGSARGS
eukprot:SM000086S23061  [mRNA]  locus=s86:578959:583065:+ [translate_table: standard]